MNNAELTVGPGLTLERLFTAPDISGAPPTSLTFSPDHRLVTYLKCATDDYERMDLWCHDISSGHARVLVDSASLADRTLSNEEKVRRERQRITTSGIVEYYWHPDSRHLLFPMAGILYFHDTGTGETEQLTADEAFLTDVRISPDGKYISYVKNRDLFVLALDERVEKRLTRDGSETVSNGLAEFIAQEEMHRFEGYWWSPDSRHIAFTRVDETPVRLTRRYEINADGFEVFDQRYPYAGTDNAKVDLGIAAVSGDITWIDLPDATDSYLARINWFCDSERLAVQVQSRNQQVLTLYACARDNSLHQKILMETSDTWVNLADSFRSIPGYGILWGSARSGFHHLYLVSDDGSQTTQLTGGNWVVTRVVGVDEKAGLVYFEGRMDTPLENHLYVASLGGDPITRLTEAGHWHQVEISKDYSYFVDRYSGAWPSLTPPAVRLLKLPAPGDASDATDAQEIFSNRLDDASHPLHACRDSLGQITFGTLTANDGATLHYRLIQPANLTPGSRYPVIVTVYGGPGVQRVTNEWIPPWHHYMASRGYVLFQLDNRGSANRGRAFEAPIHMTLGTAEVDDQLLGVDFLSTLPFADPARVGVFGHSYGGYMTLMLMAKAPNKFRAGISVAPVSDWLLYDTHYTERFLGMPDANAEGYDRSSVFPFLHNIAGELLLIHGMADDNVLFTHSTRLYKALQDANIPFEMMNYPGAKHGISGRKTNMHRYGTMDRFFDRHLKGTS